MNSPKTNIQLVVLLGVAIGFSVAVRYLPGGYDSYSFYLRAPFSDTTAPAWVYLVTYPLSLLGWPLGWQVLTLASVLFAGAAGYVWDNKKWWIVLVSTPMLWNIWLGQIELFPVFGVLLTGLVLQKKLASAWLGVSWLALLTKPQVGLGILILQIYWVWQDRNLGKRALFNGLVICVAILVVTLAAWPGWFPNWILTLRTFQPTWWNGAVWPYGLLAWPMVIFASKKANRLQKLRMFSAASLLGSPYFALYHCTNLLTLTDNLAALIISWLIIIIGGGIPEHWMKWAWLLPAGILAMDLATSVIAMVRPTPVAIDASAAMGKQ